MSIPRIRFVVEVSGSPGTVAPRGTGPVTTTTPNTEIAETAHPIRRATVVNGARGRRCRGRRRRRSAFASAVALTALSCLPSVTMPPDAATKIVPVAVHVLAAVIMVRVLARQLRARA